MRTNIGLVIFPAVLCLMLYGIQRMVDSVFTATSTDTCECNCMHMPPANRTTCEFSCEMKYLKMGLGQKMPCPVPNPTRWPALVQVPEVGDRVVRGKSMCVDDDSCPVMIFLTGEPEPHTELGMNLFGDASHEDFSSPTGSLDVLKMSEKYILGTSASNPSTYFLEPAFLPDSTMYIIQQRCEPGLDIVVSSQIESIPLMQAVKCVQGLLLWRLLLLTKERSLRFLELTKIISDAAYDFLNTKETEFNVHIWYNGSNNGAGNTRILRSVNAASNSYLQFIRGTNVKMLLEYVREMPKLATGTSKLNVSTILGPLFSHGSLSCFFQ
ncbi:ABC transporter A family member 8 [Acorus calamus]|uniref:ABC transporter A family member 8 n=1 Tax=Acorus calamus TaxID=4465 RepID=A0AAV9DEM1_ACOCL|nr:ABC transporter A family member 8 [Acorus calamus]